MASLPDDLWAKWLSVYDMLFKHGAVGLKLKAKTGDKFEGIHDDRENRYRDIIFALPHPVAHDRKADVKIVRDTIFNQSLVVMKYVLDDILSGDVIDDHIRWELRTKAKAKPLDFDAFWKNMVGARVKRYLSWITIQYWGFLLCHMYKFKAAEVEEDIFHFKLDDFRTWDKPDVPPETRIVLQAASGVVKAERSNQVYISRGVKEDYRPNIWQLETMKQCLRTHGVPYIDIHHDRHGTFQVKVPAMWDFEDFPLPFWKPPLPWNANMSDSERKKVLQEFADAGAITDLPNITMNADRALGGSPTMLTLYNQWRSDLERLSVIKRNARKGAVAAETAARSDASAGLTKTSFLIYTQNNPPVKPSNFLLLGKENPLFVFSDHPKVVSLALKWVYQIPIILRSMGEHTSPLDPVNPDRATLELNFDGAADHLDEILTLLKDDKEVPADVLPATVSS